ncbi:DUF3363 domain-containing protein [Pelagibius litoralis]|uniref:DUF3363 domain-containing protein n=1 Tax=Pelagibius litoralis TaxID=374515 RepID=A0A967F1H8_9PROT|nr:DUF3363 domain-containing protein [Pelagibius litoralis]NIA71318.1 DUF3363 domain-containing protein [Pelagibius litoralis]
MPEQRRSGIYPRSVQFVSRKYALVERWRELNFVPWQPVIEKALGQQFTGLARGSGISWDFGRMRRLGLGM